MKTCQRTMKSEESWEEIEPQKRQDCYHPHDYWNREWNTIKHSTEISSQLLKAGLGLFWMYFVGLQRIYIGSNREYSSY